MINPFDHALVLEDDSPYLTETIRQRQKLILYSIQPTAENMLIDMVARVKDHLPENTELLSMKLFETRSSWAEWFASDNN